MERTKVVLDTNFLIYCVRYKINFFDEMEDHELYLVEPVLREVEKISKGKSKNAPFARVALRMIKDMEILKSDLKADDSLVFYSKKGYAVATQDKELQKRCKDEVFFVRQKKFIRSI
ncbi:MAG TPA: PIN domain-containing protein [archaeon]|nr:PIN domain-containing protein [archaeon]